MDNEKFEAILILIVPQIIHLITENYGWGEIEACEKFYDSIVYEELENEATKLWHFSPLTLFNMFDEEQKNGVFRYPEEG